MEGFLHAVSSVTIILLLTATGYFCAARGWMGPDAKRFISKFTMSVAIPCMCVYGLTKNLTRELLALSPGPFSPRSARSCSRCSQANS